MVHYLGALARRQRVLGEGGELSRVGVRRSARHGAQSLAHDGGNRDFVRFWHLQPTSPLCFERARRGFLRDSIVQGLKPVVFYSVSARLKPCPDTFTPAPPQAADASAGER